MMRRNGAVGLSLGLSVWLCLWAVVLSGCAAAGSGATPPTDPLDPTALRSDLRSAAASASTASSSRRPTVPVVPQPTVTGVDPSLASYVDIARADLSKRLAVDPSAIEVTAAGSVTWTNSALGCPAPGMSYIDEVIDGALVILRSGGQEYRYHAGGARGPFLCAR
ncbi:MAG TPA: hypothetical protein PKC73_12050 [Dermatophilaceae bacterium]|jgi:hypothetical protein|nr:hypothetical protein [Actinomycetales bacterium]HMT31481.1 hypothetical protein [Dermatophilaceae bacterium]HMT90354.1 hypothetical protein [Dermatophilaceae bacterium]